ncbi:unnamed protein product, partial [Ectocarpus sp. 13 AM-2016]
APAFGTPHTRAPTCPQTLRRHSIGIFFLFLHAHNFDGASGPGLAFTQQQRSCSRTVQTDRNSLQNERWENSRYFPQTNPLPRLRKLSASSSAYAGTRLGVNRLLGC